MSENEYQQLVERMLEHDATSPMISSETGVKAAKKAGKLATQEEIEWAVAGGLAMHFYGSPRMTKDVDIIASNDISLTPATAHSISSCVASLPAFFAAFTPVSLEIIGLVASCSSIRSTNCLYSFSLITITVYEYVVINNIFTGHVVELQGFALSCECIIAPEVERKRNLR